MESPGEPPTGIGGTLGCVSPLSRECRIGCRADETQILGLSLFHSGSVFRHTSGYE